ncbi:DNRLRE domain-containing protein [Nonomuraea deserti]|uniref:DNRLRE domain-containing protein n=1 Tax=Nonomuraea deserti TaxID=1848322 RepID=A0A4R4UNR6_9ACTN|nr:DNRLRE domain-containing protein [Nonomuraea deserti]TDC90804.1 DNRLRE domain-containing protein [Nonomuraea deserti]
MDSSAPLHPDLAEPPDPRSAADAAELVALLGRLRLWAGRPSLRLLARLARKGPRDVTPLPDSTISYVLAGRGLPRLPRLEFVEEYVAACLKACDFSAAEIEAQLLLWRETWRRISLGDVAPPPSRPEELAPQPEEPALPPQPEPAPLPQPEPSSRSGRPRRVMALVAVAVVAATAAFLVRGEPRTESTFTPAATTDSDDMSVHFLAAADASTVTHASGTRLEETGPTLPAGRAVDGRTYRTYLRFDLPRADGRQPRAAELVLWNHESSSCGTPRPTLQVRRLTSAWQGRPATTAADAVSTGKAFGAPGCAADYLRLDVTGIVRAWARGAPNHGLQLRAAPGASAPHVHTFYATERGEEGGAPELDITYNTPPPAPARLGDTTATGAGGVRVATTAEFSMWALIADADGEWVDARFEISHDPAYGRGGVVWTGAGSSSAQEAARITLDSRVLTPGGRYRWRVRGDDGSAMGPWSPYLAFHAAPKPAQGHPSSPS